MSITPFLCSGAVSEGQYGIHVAQTQIYSPFRKILFSKKSTLRKDFFLPNALNFLQLKFDAFHITYIDLLTPPFSAE